MLDTCDDYVELLNEANNYEIASRGSFLSPNDAGRLAVTSNIANSVSRHLDDEAGPWKRMERSDDIIWRCFIWIGKWFVLWLRFTRWCRVHVWLMEWDSLKFSWKHSNTTGIVSWIHRPVTVWARRHRDRGLAPARLYVQLRGSANEPKISLLKTKSKKGFRVIIGGPQARPSNAQLSRCFIRCFGETTY